MKQDEEETAKIAEEMDMKQFLPDRRVSLASAIMDCRKARMHPGSYIMHLRNAHIDI